MLFFTECVTQAVVSKSREDERSGVGCWKGLGGELKT